ncbi:venom carboxylesterase-6-like [Nasonia vitripennis]|uniref:Uncharacterized protein n=1 Tax=Nasonia vitripennis TaxID=7425 RepID=A0A7M7TCQ6_NASVI|nr:venom carboxylesterase-6-like [Nasonia vitripennis]
MQQNMLDFWESLASTRSPDLGTQWPRLNASSSDFEYMNIAGPGKFKMKTNNNLGEIHFWDQIGLSSSTHHNIKAIAMSQYEQLLFCINSQSILSAYSINS